jgi:hypothetical protein
MARAVRSPLELIMLAGRQGFRPAATNPVGWGSVRATMIVTSEAVGPSWGVDAPWTDCLSSTF